MCILAYLVLYPVCYKDTFIVLLTVQNNVMPADLSSPLCFILAINFMPAIKQLDVSPLVKRGGNFKCLLVAA